MPPKPRITRQMILDAAYAIAREQGADQINARSIAQRLGCSTQPVLYHFDHIEDIRREVYRMADAAQTAFLLQFPEDANPLLAIGLNYIRFAAEEKLLFRMLFQSDSICGQSITDLISVPDLQPVLRIFQQESGLNAEQTEFVFKALTLLVHGYASMLANNSMKYDEAEIAALLEKTFTGLICAFRTEENPC